MVLCSAISEVFLRKLAKQGFVRYVEGSEFVDTSEDLIEAGEADGGGLKEMDEKLKTRIENLKDMVLYRFGSTGVVQVLSRAAEVLGLVPVFPVRNVNTFGSGAAGSNAVFRDCVLVKKGSTVRDCARKIMGDAPLAYVEGAGGVRVSEDEIVEVGKHDVSGFGLCRRGVILMVYRFCRSRSADRYLLHLRPTTTSPCPAVATIKRLHTAGSVSLTQKKPSNAVSHIAHFHCTIHPVVLAKLPNLSCVITPSP